MAPLTKKQLERNRKGGIALRNKYGMEYLRQMGKRGGQTTSRRVRRGRRALEKEEQMTSHLPIVPVNCRCVMINLDTEHKDEERLTTHQARKTV